MPKANIPAESSRPSLRATAWQEVAKLATPVPGRRGDAFTLNNPVSVSTRQAGAPGNAD